MRQKLFLSGCVLWLMAEVMNVYFIMPMPGSQQGDVVIFSWFLFHYRWIWRGIFGLMMLIGAGAAFRGRARWWNIPLTLLLLIVIYAFNLVMRADHMFLPVTSLDMKHAEGSRVPADALVLGVRQGEETAAYPIRFLAYHHQVTDTLAGRPVMVTYCSVCRTGRAYRPAVEGRWQRFRLVGMDHFNAMFEDEQTGSWWRQSNGLCVAGPLKGQRLEEIPSEQMPLSVWLTSNPGSTVMQADSTFTAEYDDGRFEKGTSRSSLTGTDPKAWQAKSWVVGIEDADSSRAYAWQDLESKGWLVDRFRDKPIVILLGHDKASFLALRLADTAGLRYNGDSLYAEGTARSMVQLQNIPFGRERLRAYQEFWHSWKTFHPHTSQYQREPGP